ncbi:MAG: PIN domain-containing protein [Planctomycetota bacterium]
MGPPVYLDTSAVLRATIESGTTPSIAEQIRNASALVTSRLSLVESARAFLRLRALRAAPAARLDAAEHDADALWARCDLFELTPDVCAAAARVSPALPLRALDALHLATFLSARRRLPDLTLLTADERLREAVARA